MENKKRKYGVWIPVTVVIVIIVISIMSVGWIKNGKTKNVNTAATYSVERGDLTISVTESGSLKAMNAVDILSEVERRTTIVSILSEGTYVTAEDVNDKKLLIELDSSELTERLTRQQIDLAGAESRLTEATEGYEIQKNQNESDITAGKLDLKFKEMDVKKYIGEELAEQIINDPNMAIAELINDERLGGKALQELRRLQSDIDLKEEELRRASSRLSGTKRLHEKKYVATDDLEADKLSEKRSKIELEKAKTSLEIYVRYEFVKEIEKTLSDHKEAMRELERKYAQARSRIAQKEAHLKSSEAQHKREKERLEKNQKQIAACKIYAKSPGMVVYEQNRYRGDQTPLQVGSEVHHRQKLMQLPNTADMAVEVKVHESNVDKVKPDQIVGITVDAFQDKQLTGKVVKVAPLPDQQNRWLNPDLKVYKTKISIDDSHDFLKPGMSAKAEIIITELKNVLYIPIQTVVNRDNDKYCYVLNGQKTEELRIATGQFNDMFIEVLSGLKEGQKVLLNPPRIIQDSNGKKNNRKAN